MRRLVRIDDANPSRQMIVDADPELVGALNRYGANEGVMERLAIAGGALVGA